MAEKRKDNKNRILRKGEQQRKDNAYSYRWTNPNGKRQYIYARTLDELRQKESEINQEVSMGISRTSVTLNQQIEIYLSIKVKLANSTMENYKYYYEHSIKSSKIGNMKIVDIKKSDILLFYRSLTMDGLSAGTVKIVHKIIRPALQLACDDNIIFKNPADGCTKEYAEDTEKKYALSFAEEAEFLERIRIRPKMSRYYPMYAIMLHTGLRISEAVGLTWDNVDMDKRELHIDHQIQYRQYHGKYQFYADTTKTSAGNRVIHMTDDIHRLFLEQRKEWFKVKKDPDFSVDGYKNFVFVSHMTGKCMNHSNIRRMIRSIVAMNNEREVQLPDISPHILRHTTCCRLAEAGCDIKVLQYIMGQTDIRTTMQVYNHVDQERIKREMDKLKGLNQYTPFFTPFAEKLM